MGRESQELDSPRSGQVNDELVAERTRRIPYMLRKRHMGNIFTIEFSYKLLKRMHKLAEIQITVCYA